MAPRLALYIQDFNTVQRHAGLTAAPEHIDQAFVVNRRAVDAALRHGRELLPVQRLDRTHRHLLHRHVSRAERRGRTITHTHTPHRRGGRERDKGGKQERAHKGGTQEVETSRVTSLFLSV